MSKKCPICGRGIGVYQDYVGGTSFFRCDICGHTGCDFEDVTVFDQITRSYETLAEKLVVEYRHGVKDYAYYSTVTCELYNTRPEALAATIEKLKEVVE